MKLHLWTTPNGYKPLIMLEEIGADFELIKVPLDGTQKKPDYVKLNPNGRIPTLVDGDLVVFESGAILLYLAEKTGKFLPSEPKARYNVIQWLMFQMGGVGPMFWVILCTLLKIFLTVRLYTVVENSLTEERKFILLYFSFSFAETSQKKANSESIHFSTYWYFSS